MYIGIDMGGTNIDGVIISKGKIIKKIKNIVNREDIFNSILFTIKELVKDIDKSKIKRINLSTTISTNAIVENKISDVAMILETGPGINYDFNEISDDIFYIKGYIDHRGKIVKNIDIDEIENIKIKLKEKNIDSLAIVTKFSTRNPSFENKLNDYFKNDFNNITLGHSISGKLNFPRRVNTTYLNTAVYKTYENFVKNIKKALEKENINGDIFVLKADGGTMYLEDSKNKPVETILSGPAASFMGINALFKNEEDSVLLDIGGTTTDIFFLVDGIPVFEPMGIEIDGYKTLVRAIYSNSIGVGGDSVVEILNGKIKIGPERKDKPMALGGKYPTPTDAMIVLEELNIGDKNKSLKGINILAKELNIDEIELSKLILETMLDKIYIKVNELLDKINSKPLYTVREVLENRKVIPKEIKIIGGPANILSKYIEDKFKIKTNYPKNFEIANAIGAAVSKPTFEINLLADTDREILSIPEINLYEKINHNFNLENARNITLNSLENIGKKYGDNIETEIVEENSFNMIDGYTRGKNIRIKAQIKPGIIYKIGDEIDES